ncbi:MAG: hypothetical protein HON90_06430 [Halobacteriovoraceae bacterium]|nr:hypothetical protein [Halobacteriovoraceae bacterium]
MMGFTYDNPNGGSWFVEETEAISNLPENKKPPGVKRKCEALFSVDSNGQLRVKVDTPEISKNFKNILVDDDDGFLTILAIYRSLRNSKQSPEKHILDSYNARSLLLALKRMKDYSHLMIEKLLLKKPISILPKKQKLLADLKKSKVFATKMLKRFKASTLNPSDLDLIGIYLQKNRTDKFYTNPYKKNKPSLIACNQYPTDDLGSFLEESVDHNNPIAQTLCNVNFETMEPVNDVYSQKSTNCNYELNFIKSIKPNKTQVILSPVLRQ